MAAWGLAQKAKIINCSLWHDLLISCTLKTTPLWGLVIISQVLNRGGFLGRFLVLSVFVLRGASTTAPLETAFFSIRVFLVESVLEAAPNKTKAVPHPRPPYFKHLGLVFYLLLDSMPPNFFQDLNTALGKIQIPVVPNKLVLKIFNFSSSGFCTCSCRGCENTVCIWSNWRQSLPAPEVSGHTLMRNNCQKHIFECWKKC